MENALFPSVFVPRVFCSAEKIFKREFLVLPWCTHNVILGIDFLTDCGVSFNCVTCDIDLNSAVLATLPVTPSEDKKCFVFAEDLLILPWSLHMSALTLPLPIFHYLARKFSHLLPAAQGKVYLCHVLSLQ